jgi:hypothetical protein
MGYEDGQAKKTGRLGEKEAIEFLATHGFSAEKPGGQDIGIDLLVSLQGNIDKVVKVQVKGRGQVANPRWFQLSITPSQIKSAWTEGRQLDLLWKNKIKMVDFWMMVSIPLNEVWVIPSDKVIEIAKLNSVKYNSRLDNQFDKPHYTKHGKLAKKQKELNLDIEIDGVPIWQQFLNYQNNAKAIMEYFNP